MAAGNNALNNNLPTSAIDINTRGSDWLWAVFAVMLLTDLLFIFWAYTRPRGQRAFHFIPVAILSVASIAYFSLASDLGSTPITAEFYGNHHQNYAGMPATRAIWYVRYIDWVITFPLLLLELFLVTGLPASDIFASLFMSVVAVVSALIGALVASSYKWGYFAFAVAALLFVIFTLHGPGRASAGVVGNDVRSVHTRGAAWLSLVLLLYPISWGLSEGGNVITSDGEMIFYGILDLFAKPFFLLFHVFSMRGIDLARIGHTGVGVGGVGPGSSYRNMGNPEKMGNTTGGTLPDTNAAAIA